MKKSHTSRAKAGRPRFTGSNPVRIFDSVHIALTQQRGEEMIDKERLEQAVAMMLSALGEDPERPGLKETPKRVAAMYEELCSGMEEQAADHLKKRFPMEKSEIVLERDIPFYSLCEHHLLPFFGKAHIAYIPDKEVVGLSKLARTVEVFARRLQLQEQMNCQIADAIMEELKPKGVIVLLEAEHLCMTMRGVKKPGSKTTTITSRGVFETEPDKRQLFFQMLGRSECR